MAAEAKGDGKTSVLFLCLGNICRSPAAESVFKWVVKKEGVEDKFVIDSCGTGGNSPNWYKPNGASRHIDDPPDERMRVAASKRGIEVSGKSRALKPEDLDNFDLIVGMDENNSERIDEAARFWGKAALATSKFRTMASFCRNSGDVKDVPDPYFGGEEGFEKVLDLLDDACYGLLERCQAGKA